MADRSDKGVHGGACNRSACQRPGANHYNDQTGAYYCPRCAQAINSWSRNDLGRDICTRAPETARETAS